MNPDPTQTILSTGSKASLATPDPISPELLGAEFLGWENFNNFATRQTEVGYSHLRWPGGIPAEDGIDTDGDGIRDKVYDLTAPDLVTGWNRGNTPREGLSDMLAFANERGVSFSMLVPTAPYVSAGLETGRQDGINQARADVREFITRLASGEFGDVPSDLTLEIGSEYHATQVWKNNRDVPDMPERFGEIFAAIADEIKDTLAAQDAAGQNTQAIDPRVAVQVGRFHSADDAGNVNGQFSDNAAFIDAFRDAAALDAIDALIWHRYIPSFDRIGLYTDRPAAGGYAERDNSLFTTTEDLWRSAVGGKDLDLVVGWSAPALQQATSLEFGAPGLGNILQTFATMASLGADVGSIYGLGSQYSGALATKGEVFIGGQLYALMAESLPGMQLHAGFRENIAPQVGGVFTETDAVNRYVFEDADKIVVFLAARALTGTSLTHTISVDQSIASVEATHLWDPNGIDTIDPENIGVVGELKTSVPSQVSNDQGGADISVEFRNDFEVIRLTLYKSAPDAPNILISGTENAEALFGTQADEDIFGGGGNDKLFGGGGDDRLYDGDGTDNLLGQAGADIFVLAQDGEADTIKDYEIDVDRIDLSAWNVVSFDALDIVHHRSGKLILRHGDETLAIDAVDRGDIAGGLTASAFILQQLTLPVADIVGTAENDKLLGTAASERIFDGDGADSMFGRAGADTFVLSADGRNDAVKDFEDGLDILDISAWGLRGITDLQITAHRSGKVIVKAGDEALSINDAAWSLTPAHLDAEDFVF